MIQTIKNKITRVIIRTSVVIAGLLSTALVGWLMADSALRVWQVEAITEAERLSTELNYRVQREREPLVAISILYFGSTEVTQDELIASRAQLVDSTARNPMLSLGFVTRRNEDGFLVQQAAGDLPLLPTGQSYLINEHLVTTIEQAFEQKPAIVTGALFKVDDISYLPLAIAVPNAEMEGVLVCLIDFSHLLEDVTRGIIANGTTVEIYHPEFPNVNYSSLPALNSAQEMSHQTEIDMGLYRWELIWHFDADNGNPVDYRLTYVSIAFGLAITALLTFIIHNILQQQRRVEQQVKEKSAELEDAHSKMVQQGRMAALGGMVAGISHELNTPVGNSLMAATVLRNRTAEVRGLLTDNNLKHSDLSSFLEFATDSSRIIEENIRRATELVKNFKQVAVDQTSERRRSFSISVMINELVTTLSPQLRHTSHRLEVVVPEHVLMNSYPGPLGQVITNLVMNSLTHAFESHTSGLMQITVRMPDDLHLSLEYSDNGCGIDEKIKSRIFDPFFTTQLGQGSSGLGLHIAYNIVTDMLGGEIKLDEKNSKGVRFLITLPLEAPERRQQKTQDRRNTPYGTQ
ncbi:MAG: HAMP domain-containing sensor histidine kinase [Gammaproteobacteria bacterium]|nr:HAMP domain-containing sensor histidine kinase [Gammaproteobacteria bacterium]MDP2139381.1 HAMP domain-containing sensor histidine kinase [Gammaproteobacteria bacterium]MDP2346217.1 HAMP domain-containing sensor histidine kinase [Gammaproteobacteria bacterium]